MQSNDDDAIGKPKYVKKFLLPGFFFFFFFVVLFFTFLLLSFLDSSSRAQMPKAL
jgi:hypothetical protein